MDLPGDRFPLFLPCLLYIDGVLTQGCILLEQSPDTEFEYEKEDPDACEKHPEDEIPLLIHVLVHMDEDRLLFRVRYPVIMSRSDPEFIAARWDSRESDTV